MSSQRPKVYFRADGNSQIGLGHVYRSLALVEMIKAEFDCIFLIRTPLETLQSRIQDVAQLISLPQPTNDLEEAAFIAANYLTGNEIVVLDGYHFVTNYQKNIKAKGSKLVCIDDIYAYHFVADAIINHAGGILPTYYTHDFYTQTFLGLNYLLLRPEFLTIAKSEYSKPNSTAIFICMGGADPHNDTLKVLQKIEEKHPQQKIKCYVVIGQAYLYKAVLQSFAQNSSLDIEILNDLSAQQMLNYMQLCPIAICPPSSVSFEYLSTKGVLYLLQTADNQKDAKKYLLNEKLALDFELEYPVTDSNVMKERLEIQRKVIDGKSGERLLAVFQHLSKEINN